MDERPVRDAFREAVVRYCNLANAAGRPRTDRPVTITVTTAEPLSPETQEWIYDLARAHTRRMLRTRPDPVLSFPTSAGLPGGHRFGFQPPALPGPRETRPEPPPVVRPVPAGPVAVLTLRYDTDFVWPCRIGAATDWLAVGRSVTPATAMQLPTYATWLPRGRILLVRNHDRRFVFGRSASHPQYEIRIDGDPLWPGGSVTARTEGSIEYASGRSSTYLTYRVDWESRHGR